MRCRHHILYTRKLVIHNKQANNLAKTMPIFEKRPVLCNIEIVFNGPNPNRAPVFANEYANQEFYYNFLYIYKKRLKHAFLKWPCLWYLAV